MKKSLSTSILVGVVFLVAAIQAKAQWEYMTPMPTARGFAANCVVGNKVYVMGGVSSQTSPAMSTVEVYDPVNNSWESGPDLPVALSAAAAVELEGKIYIIGGQDLGTKSAAVFELDPDEGGGWVQKNDLPAPREWHTATVYDNTIYVMGGSTGNLPENVLLRYDKTNDLWIAESGMPGARSFLRAETVQGKIYAMGGMSLGVPYATMSAYDKDTGGWVIKASMPGPKFWFGSGVIDDQLYVFGGANEVSPPAYSSGTWRYDPVANDWTNIGVEFPEKIAGFSYATTEDTNGNLCLYTFGGGDALFNATDVVLKFCPKKSDWEYQEAVPTPRAFATNCVLNDKVYVIGGESSKNGPATAKVEAYDWTTDTWDTDIANLPVALSGASSKVVDGKIYVMGGREFFNGQPYDYVFEYDPDGNVWTEKTPLSWPRSWMGAAELDNKIYTMGGYGVWHPDTVTTDALTVYDPAVDDWKSLTSMPSPRAYLTAETLGGKIYSIGGLHLEIGRSAVEEYDPLNDTWTVREDMPAPRFFHGSSAGFDNAIYVYGGAESYTSLSPDFWKFTPSENIWEDMDNNLPEMISAFATSIIQVSPDEQCIYTFGGALPGYWLGGADPIVSGAVYKYCMDFVVSTKESAKADDAVVFWQNYPNPFQAYTTIQYELRNATEVSIKVHNLAGQEVATVFNGFQPAGRHQVGWNAEGLAAGVYFYTLQTGEFTGTGKLVIQR